MDVICDQCKAEYDFDEALLGEKGTTVKCSRCGHVFRVLPPKSDAAPGSALQLKFARDGSVVALGSLRELQQRIAAGEVGRDDELGREGHAFRRLGDVPELKNFFPASEASATPRAANPARLPQRTVMGLGPAGAPPARPASVRPPAARPPAVVPGAARPDPNRLASDTGDAPTLPATAAHLARGEVPGKAGPSSLPPPNARLAPANFTARSAGSGPVPAATKGAIATPVAPKPAERRLRFDADDEGPGSDEAARVPISSMPTQPAALPTEGRVPTSGAPTKLGPAGVRRLALDTAEALENRPNAPLAAPGRAHPMGLNTEDRLERPGAFPRSFQSAAAPDSAPAPVKLRVGGDEDEPREREGGSSTLLYIAGGAVLLAAAAWGGLALMAGPKAHDSALAAPDAAAPSLASPTPPDAAALQAPDAADHGAGSSASATPPTKPPEKPTEERPTDKPSTANSAGAKPSEAVHKPAVTAHDPVPDGKDYGALVARGDQLFAKKDLAGARDAYSAAVALRGSGSEANSGLGFVLLAQGDLRAALPPLARAAGSGYAEASIGLGDVQRKLGNVEDAIEAYGTYLARMPNGPRASYARAQLDALSGHAAPTSPSPARDTEEPQNAPSSGYQPAGEVKSPSGPSTDTTDELTQ